MTQSEDFEWAIAFAWSPIFKMVSFLEYLVFFGALFRTEQLEMICRMDFDTFFRILIFDLTWEFSMGYIAFVWWPIFKIVSFLEYLLFFWPLFGSEQLLMICRMDFDMFIGISIFYLKLRLCKGYFLCMMADFQNGLISRILNVFWSGFLHRTTRNDLQIGFLHLLLDF